MNINRHIIRYRSIYYFLIPLMLCGCSTSKAPISSPSLQTTNLLSSENINAADNQPSNSPEKKDSNPVVAGSNLPSSWVSSKDKAISCRIKQWASYSLGTNVKVEFMNLASQNPINIVYTVMVGDDKGEPIPVFNAYRKEQFNITNFKPRLKKGETKMVEFNPKHVTAFSVELKSCRIATKNENSFNINPEMVDDGGP